MSENTTLQSITRWLWKENKSSFPNTDAFTRLYEETYLIVFRYIYGLSGGPLQDAEDLTAETYERAWKARRQFTGSGKAALGWLLRIAKNLVIDVARRRKVRGIAEDVNIEVLMDPALVPETDIVTREQIETLWRMLRTLSEDAREMVVLRYILGWQVMQIASYLDRSQNTVSVTIRRALKTLQRDWPESQEEDHE